MEFGSRIASWLAFILLAAGGAQFAACTKQGVGDVADESLIGGRAANDGEFPSTLVVNGTCTAAKVGPRHILTAAHCAMYLGPLNPMFAPGAKLDVTAKHTVDMDGDDPSYIPVTIEQTFLHPSWVSEQKTGLNWGPNPSADVAIVVLTRDSEAMLTKIPAARIDTAPVVPGDRLVVAGYGCETGVEPYFDYTKARLKVQATQAMDPAAALVPGRVPSPDPAAHTADNYFFTPGAALVPDAQAASLCPGDSGGPVYRDDGTQQVIVGVNAQYNFAPTDHVGVSLSNWHTRLDNAAAVGVGEWVQRILRDDFPDAGVNDGSVPGDAGAAEPSDAAGNGG